MVPKFEADELGHEKLRFDKMLLAIPAVTHRCYILLGKLEEPAWKAPKILINRKI
jgi:hypothetical protein